MEKSKLKTTSSKFGAAGGKTKMHSKMGVIPSHEGVSAHPSKPGFNKAPPKGGKTKMFAKSGSRAAPTGGPALSKPGAGTGGKFGVSGGKGKMFGHSGADTARAK